MTTTNNTPKASNPSAPMFALKRAPCGRAFQTLEAMYDHRVVHGCGRRVRQQAKAPWAAVMDDGEGVPA